MKRIAVVGCSGGGKSTLARALGAALATPVIHFDALFWKPGWVESEPEPFRAAVDAALQGDRWVSDGNFSAVGDITYARADTIVWLERPAGLCLRRAVWRALSDLGRTRPDLAPGCPEKIDFEFYRYILNWERATRPRLQAVIDAFGSHARLVRLRSDSEITAWLAKVSVNEL